MKERLDTFVMAARYPALPRVCQFAGPSAGVRLRATHALR
jgi:hypothetical protein